METVSLQKTIEIIAKYDVIVAGAGPAGICAAVAASRMGSSVALVERYGVVGGNLSVGHVGPILGAVGKGTMREEIVRLLDVPFNDMIGEVGVAHDMEKAKIRLAQFVDRPNITVYLQTAAAEVIKEGSRITGLILSGKEGLRAITGAVIIDCTGDGDVSALAGAITEKGREDGLMQPCTLEFTIDNVDESRAVVCIGDVDEVKLGDERFLDFCKRRAQEGALPGNLAAVRLHRTVYPGQRQVNTTQANGIDATKTADIFRAETELRRQIDILMDFLRRNLPGYENCQLISSGATLGVRESRRVMGEYTLTEDDVVAGRTFDDVVVHKAEFIVDIHNPAGPGQAEDRIQYCVPYDIPYRCLVPLRVEGLLVAGRCISGTHKAHASYRIMTVCMALGQAAGTAAALCAQGGELPRTLDVRKVQDALASQGVDLFYK